MTILSKNLGGMAPLPPLATPMRKLPQKRLVSKNESIGIWFIKKK